MFNIVSNLRSPRVAEFGVVNPEPAPGATNSVRSTPIDGLRATRRPSRVVIVAFGALAFLAGGAVTQSAGADAQTSPPTPTTTPAADADACATVASGGPVPATERETRPRPATRHGRLNWIAV